MTKSISLLNCRFVCRRQWSYSSYLIFLSLSLFGLLIGEGYVVHAELTKTSEPQMICNPKKLVVAGLHTVSLEVWIPVDQLKVYKEKGRDLLTADHGRLSGDLPHVSWDFSKVTPVEPPNVYSTTLRLVDSSLHGADLTCTFHVYYEEGVKSGEDIDRERNGTVRESASVFLTPSKKEQKGYGLYSYLLLGAKPTADMRARYVAAIQAYLDMFPEIKSLERHIMPSELNATYLPVLRQPNTVGSVDTASFILEQYDYARARIILHAVKGQNLDGPYIVSAKSPIDGDNGQFGPEILYQDLSLVPPFQVRQWVKQFIIQASQENPYEQNNLKQLVQRLRMVIGILAQALPDIDKLITTKINSGIK